MKPSQLELFDLTQYDVRLRSIEDDCPIPDNSLTELETLTKSVSELFPSVGETASINSLTELETLTELVSELFPPASAHRMDAVNLYQPAGTAKGRHQYFRFSWRDRNGVNHQHIPGGNSTNPIAASRAAQVKDAIAAGSSTAEVLKLIRSWGRSVKSKI
ncbi:hypothetical protein PN499_23315 [Kamptonema animale CS-326]|jgi:hypothetical protein|uniref:hypothetical protein n=1 Tax=Kamptonema animale TaxID=92934 RepID=UPI00232C0459|nr:hypothetical protein [Kamptonema animale]MDB9514135.1 hypothetical protein [Kamptonema animale CS-326]